MSTECTKNFKKNLLLCDKHFQSENEKSVLILEKEIAAHPLGRGMASQACLPPPRTPLQREGAAGHQRRRQGVREALGVRAGVGDERRDGGVGEGGERHDHPVVRQALQHLCMADSGLSVWSARAL